MIGYNSQGTKAVKGMTLKLPRANAKCFSTKTFKKMTRLRLLQLAGVRLDGNFEHLSRNLKWLSWNGFPLTHIPGNFSRRNLVSIELENSNVKLVWKEAQVLPIIYLKLKYLFSSLFMSAFLVLHVPSVKVFQIFELRSILFFVTVH